MKRKKGKSKRSPAKRPPKQTRPIYFTYSASWVMRPLKRVGFSVTV